MKIKPLNNFDLYKNLQLSRNSSSEEHLSVSSIEKYLPENKNANILDVGCRSGKTICKLLSMGYINSHGLDIGDSIWSTYEEKIKKHFHRGDIHEGIPFSNKFDLILCSHAFEHFYGPSRVIKIFKNHLNDNGIIFISIPLDYNSRQMEHAPHYTFFESQEDLQSFLESNGLKIIDIYTNNNGPGGYPEVLSFSTLQ